MTRQDLADWESEATAAAATAAASRCTPAGRSTRPTRRNSPARMRPASCIFRAFDPEAAAWLLKERNVVGLAVDTLSLDPGNSKRFQDARDVAAVAGRWGIENIANLDKVPATGATLVAGVPKVKDATGAPARILALV